jgi:hypothetical protein
MGSIDHIDLLGFVNRDEFDEGQVFIWLLQLVRCFWMNLPLRFISRIFYFFWAMIWITTESHVSVWFNNCWVMIDRTLPTSFSFKLCPNLSP